jgi:nucleotide-binding universal stress UspA family protein
MSRKTLVNTVGQYLEMEDRLTQAADPLQTARFRQDVEKAGQELRAQLQCARHASQESGAIQKILVAVDHADQSRWAMERAIQFAKCFDARVTVVHVVDLSPVALPELAFYDDQAQRALIDAGSEIMNRHAAKVPLGLLADTMLREGNIPQQIVAAASEMNADLVVLGTHGRGAIGRFLLGSTAEAVVRHSPCPVLAVGHPIVPEATGKESEPAREVVAAS